MSSIGERVAAVRDRIDIVDVIGRVVPLGKGGKPRGKCPFHGSKSDSFAVDASSGRAKCWGCSWSGDAIAFVRDFYSMGFLDALTRLEADHGLEDLSATPVRREKVVQRRLARPTVDSIVFGRFLWSHGRTDHDAVRVYLRARGVPEPMLGDDRLRDMRFLAVAPISAWREDRKPSSVPQAPAVVALVRAAGSWSPIGAHVTFLAPDLAGKMTRKREDGSDYPSRKMLGAMSGGCVVLGNYAPDAPLFEGEGLETTLSGMAMLGGGADACAIAALSLDTMQGRPRLIKGALPLYDPEPDPAAMGLSFVHAGRVTGLIDADMKPLHGPIDRVTKRPLGVPVIERRGGPVVRRTISSGERAALCGALVVQSWRAKGCRATAMRPRMGLDFNDAVREAKS